MSEKIYRWLLWLYPRRFRETWGDAALELYRDRAREERSLLGRTLLWLDLLADAAVSIPREYRHASPAIAAVAIGQPGDALPSFQMLGNQSPRPGALALGGVVSLVIATLFSVSGGTARIYGSGSTGGMQSGSVDAAAALNEPIGSVNGGAESARRALQPDTAERRRVLEGVIVNLKAHYRDSGAAQRISDALILNDQAGAFDRAADPARFAAGLTAAMRNVSHDASLVVIYSEQPLVQPPQPRPDALERYRATMKGQNCTFEQVSILRDGIGYIKLNSFPDLSICGRTATNAMKSVNSARAVIFDLRDNVGGFPETVALMAAWLFDHPEYFYNPRENTTNRSWTRSPVPGSHLADKPVYILTSERTFSGAEQFAWDLKMLKRATIVGERTRGGAHAGVFHRVDSHFAIGIPEAKPINPFADSDWDGIGVEPDVKVDAANALERAEALATQGLRRR